MITWLCFFSLSPGRAEVPKHIGICELFKALRAHSGKLLALRGEIIENEQVFVIADAGCEEKFISGRMTWPTVVNLELLGVAQAAGELKKEIEEGRRRGASVVAQAMFVGVLRTRDVYQLSSAEDHQIGNAFGPWGNFPAEMVVDEIRDVSVKSEPPASNLKVVPVCNVLDHLSTYDGQRLAIRGVFFVGKNGHGLTGQCDSYPVIDGVPFPRAIHVSYDRLFLNAEMGFGRPSLSVAEEIEKQKGEQARGYRNVRQMGTIVGRLKVKNRLRAGLPASLAGFGNLLMYPAQFEVEVTRDFVVEPTDSAPKEPAVPNHPAYSQVWRGRVLDCSAVRTLIEAATSGCVGETRNQLQAAHVDLKNKALLQAISRGHNDIVALLLEEGVDVNSIRPRGAALCQAAGAKNPGAVRLLLRHGAAVNPSQSGDCVPLGKAAEYGTPETVEALLAADGIDLEARDEFGRTPLEAAAFRACADNMRLLLEAGADANARDESGKSLLLTYVLQPEIVRELVRGGANIHATTDAGATALMLAAGEADVESVRILLEAGADVRRFDSNGNTALMYAVQSGYVDAIPILIGAGADIRARNKAGQTASDVVSGKNATYILKALQPSP